MLEYSGKYNTAKIFTDNVEESAVAQIIELCNQLFVVNSKIRIMPDVHAGKGCVIGTTMTLPNKEVCSNLVGVDIGCFVGSTKISLLSGETKTLKEIYQEKREVWTYSLNKELKLVPGKAICKKTRKSADLMAVVISGGEKIICTPDHQFMLKSGQYKEAKDLKAKESLMPLYRSFQKRDGYESSFNKVNKTVITHKMVAHYFHGKPQKGYVVHHKDNNKYNNTPENLEILLSNSHSSLHAKENGYFERVEFKKKRLEKLKQNGFFDKKYLKKKQSVATENIMKYNNSEKAVEDSKKAGKRGRKYLVEYNKSKKGREKSSKVANNYLKHFTCEICGELMKGEIKYKQHKEKLHSNHHVISVTKLNYKEDVYCLSVEEHHNFALNAGVFVHNCGMETVKLTNYSPDFEALDKAIRENVPAGFNVRSNIHKFSKTICLEDLRCFKSLNKIDRIKLSVGTLGGGNHFIEMNTDRSKNYYLVVHSGSRNLGTQIAKHYQDLACDVVRRALLNRQDEKLAELKRQLIAQGRELDISQAFADFKKENTQVPPKHLACLIGDNFDDYINDMEIAQQYALMNRKAIIDVIVTALGLEVAESFTTIHNYIDTKSMILRKGAISAELGEKVLIPLNMRDGSLICIGKGNSDWNYSAPHGAGRTMSRSKAKKVIKLEDYEEVMEGIYSTSVGKHTLDEAPFAYKDKWEIISNIHDTVDVVEHIKSVFNFKV